MEHTCVNAQKGVSLCRDLKEEVTGPVHKYRTALCGNQQFLENGTKVISDLYKINLNDQAPAASLYHHYLEYLQY